MTQLKHSNEVNKLTRILDRLEQGQANEVPFDQRPRNCRNRDERTVYPLIQTLFRSQKKLTDGKPTLTIINLQNLFLKNSESLQIIWVRESEKTFKMRF